MESKCKLNLHITNLLHTFVYHLINQSNMVYLTTKDFKEFVIGSEFTHMEVDQETIRFFVKGKNEHLEITSFDGEFWMDGDMMFLFRHKITDFNYSFDIQPDDHIHGRRTDKYIFTTEHEAVIFSFFGHCYMMDDADHEDVSTLRVIENKFAIVD